VNWRARAKQLQRKASWNACVLGAGYFCPFSIGCLLAASEISYTYPLHNLLFSCQILIAKTQKRVA
jgi:hypothetical protein